VSEVHLPLSLATRTNQAIQGLVKLQYQLKPDPAELATAIAKAQACSIFLEACINQSQKAPA
jgi:hypothetical protein